MANYTEEFIVGYIAAMRWANTWDLESGESVDALYGDLGAPDLSTELWMRNECEAFIADAGDLLTETVATYADQRGYTWHCAGVDFALTRNGHGTGYWDRGLGRLGDALTTLAKPYGEATLYVQAGVLYYF